jgi:hypothetical protein
MAARPRHPEVIIFNNFTITNSEPDKADNDSDNEPDSKIYCKI